MAFVTIRETERYKLVFDRLMGVSRFVDKADPAVSLMDTGQDAIDICDIMRRVSDSAFDKIAAIETEY